LRWPEVAASASGGAGASEVRALMAVNPGMMMESPRSIRCGIACHTDVAANNTLMRIFANRSVAESLGDDDGATSMFMCHDMVSGQV
jgi:hypothetical protein